MCAQYIHVRIDLSLTHLTFIRIQCVLYPKFFHSFFFVFCSSFQIHFHFFPHKDTRTLAQKLHDTITNLVHFVRFSALWCNVFCCLFAIFHSLLLEFGNANIWIKLRFVSLGERIIVFVFVYASWMARTVSALHQSNTYDLLQLLQPEFVEFSMDTRFLPLSWIECVQCTQCILQRKVNSRVRWKAINNGFLSVKRKKMMQQLK